MPYDDDDRAQAASHDDDLDDVAEYEHERAVAAAADLVDYCRRGDDDLDRAEFDDLVDEYVAARAVVVERTRARRLADHLAALGVDDDTAPDRAAGHSLT